MIHSKSITLTLAALAVSMSGLAQEEKSSLPQVHGTLRGKYEYQTEDKKGRFEVRTARVSFDGKLSPIVEYKAEIDLCDEGSIKMLDAYTKIKPWKGFHFTIGQERVPFTIDAHRSPHQQYFANRSFIAKQVGNVRDVGAEVGYQFRMGFPVNIRAGIFNGSGLTNQKDFWTNNINYSAKLEMFPAEGWNVTLSLQKVKPDNVDVYMYDIGTYYHKNGWHAEVEYLYKHYAQNVFQNVHAVDAFINYDIPVKSKHIKKVSPLVRYDYMSDHSDGKHYDVTNELTGETESKLKINDYERHRLTGGVTLSLNKPFISDIRINYEKYWYPNNGTPKTSEKDKFVIEFMTRF